MIAVGTTGNANYVYLLKEEFKNLRHSIIYWEFSAELICDSLYQYNPGTKNVGTCLVSIVKGFYSTKGCGQYINHNYKNRTRIGKKT